MGEGNIVFLGFLYYGVYKSNPIFVSILKIT